MTADGTKVMYSIAGAVQSLESIAHDEGRFLAVQGASERRDPTLT